MTAAPEERRSSDSKAWRRAGWIVLLLLPMGFIAWLVQPAPATRGADDSAAQTPLDDISTKVSVASVERASLTVWAEATGYLRPWRQVEVKSETAGRVVERLVDEGERVTAGAPLLRLFDEDRRIELAEAQADLLQMRARYAVFVDAEESRRPDISEDCAEPTSAGCDDGGQAEDKARRAQELFDQGLISEEELRQSQRRLDAIRMLSGEYRGEVQAATTGLTQAELRTQRARLDLERTELRAPFTGRVADLAFEIGQQLATGETCLHLLDESRMTVEVDVLEADIVWLRPGAVARVQVPALGQEWLAGKVTSINPQVDPETGTGRAKVLIENPDGSLMPGLFTFVRLEIRRLEDRLTLPEVAILLRQGRELVFRIEDDRALWTYVTTGERSGNRVEIKEGLEISQHVAVSGHFALAHESKVTVIPAAETAASTSPIEPWNAGSAP